MLDTIPHIDTTTESTPLLANTISDASTSPTLPNAVARPYHCIVALFLHMLAVSLLLAPTNAMIIQLVCARQGDIPDDYTYAQCAANATVQKVSTSWLMALQLALNIPGLFAIPIIGLISDQYGRKRAYFLPILGAAIQYTLTLVVLIGKAHLALLLVAYILHVFLGGFLVVEAICFSYIADISPTMSKPGITPEDSTLPITPPSRGELFGQMEALLFLSFTAGPYIGGLLVSLTLSYTTPFAASLGLTVIEFFWVLLVMPESRIKATYSQETLHKTGLSQLYESSKTVIQSTIAVLYGYKRLSHFLICTVILVISFSMGSVYYLQLYTAFKWQWTVYDIGQYIFTIAIAKSLYMGILLPFLLRLGAKWYRSADLVRFKILMMRIGLIIWGIGHIAESLAPIAWNFYLIAILDGFGAVVLPLARGLVSASTEASLQGQLFATIAVMQQMASIISPILFGFLYRSSLTVFPGSIFLASSCCCLVGLCITFGINSAQIVEGSGEELMDGSEEVI